MVLILLAGSLLYPIAMFVWPWHLGALDWGPVWSGYFGLPLLRRGLGRDRADLLEHHREPTHRVLHDARVAPAPLRHSGRSWRVARAGIVGDVRRLLSASSRAYEGFARGLIDTRAILYFLSVTILCLLVAFRSLESRKWS